MTQTSTLAWRSRDLNGRLSKEIPNPDRERQRFWEKVDALGPEECWNFTGCLMQGYGHFRFQGKLILSHRFAWMLSFGKIPEGLCVCHRCDNRRCCNVRHLFLGTKKDNTEDCIKKGRFPFVACGESHPRAKFTSQDIQYIRTKYALGNTTQEAIAAEFRVTANAIGAIVKRHVWKHI